MVPFDMLGMVPISVLIVILSRIQDDKVVRYKIS